MSGAQSRGRAVPGKLFDKNIKVVVSLGSESLVFEHPSDFLSALGTFRHLDCY